MKAEEIFLVWNNRIKEPTLHWISENESNLEYIDQSINQNFRTLALEKYDALMMHQNNE